MAVNEAPVAAMCGLHGKALGGASIGSVKITDPCFIQPDQLRCCEQSISDESQRASAVLAALQHSSCVPQRFLDGIRFITMAYGKDMKFRPPGRSTNFGQRAQKLAEHGNCLFFFQRGRQGFSRSARNAAK
jgi:hypothetical protein